MARGSDTRQRILQFIQRFKETKGYAPTVREIADACTISSPSVVQYHLDRLQQNGLITREREKFRSIVLNKEKKGVVRVPLLGTIAAGQPVWVPQGDVSSATHERISVPLDMTRGRNVYALRVRGNSMVDAMISDGDIVLMEPPAGIKNGDVVAAWLKNEQEVTLKKIFFEPGGRIRLQPCNPYMTPIYQDGVNVEVQGKVVAVIRSYE
jgi:repressor LexA